MSVEWYAVGRRSFGRPFSRRRVLPVRSEYIVLTSISILAYTGQWTRYKITNFRIVFGVVVSSTSLIRSDTYGSQSLVPSVQPSGRFVSSLLLFSGSFVSQTSINLRERFKLDSFSFFIVCEYNGKVPENLYNRVNLE